MLVSSHEEWLYENNFSAMEPATAAELELHFVKLRLAISAPQIDQALATCAPAPRGASCVSTCLRNFG